MTPSSEKQPTGPRRENFHRDLWLYLSAAIISIILLSTTIAICYAFLTSKNSIGTNGTVALNFPWLSWGASLIILPALLLGLVQLAGADLFKRNPLQKLAEEQWQQALPERAQKIYRFIKGMPAVIVVLIVLLAGATLLTLEGALQLIEAVFITLAPYIPHIAAAFAAIACTLIVTYTWLKYKNRQLQEEYAFRREVLEKTGVIITGKEMVALPAKEPAETYTVAIETQPIPELPSADGFAEKGTEIKVDPN